MRGFRRTCDGAAAEVASVRRVCVNNFDNERNTPRNIQVQSSPSGCYALSSYGTHTLSTICARLEAIFDSTFRVATTAVSS